MRTEEGAAGREEAAIVFVVDDDASIREAIRGLLASVGLKSETFKTANEFLEHERPQAPACAVLDVRLPGLSGLDLQGELARRGASLPIIFITGHADVPMSVHAMKAGAVEFLTKPFRDQDLLDAIQQAIERDRGMRRRRAETDDVRRRYEALTPREREVMVLMAAGLLSKQIASKLGISEITVKVHRAQVMQKMRADSVAALVKLAARLAPPLLPG